MTPRPLRQAHLACARSERPATLAAQAEPRTVKSVSMNDLLRLPHWRPRCCGLLWQTLCLRRV